MIGLESVGRYLTRALLSVVLVVLNLTLTVAATNSDFDVSVCMKKIKWPAGGKELMVHTGFTTRLVPAHISSITVFLSKSLVSCKIHWTRLSSRRLDG